MTVLPGSDEAFLISHISLGFVYCLGQRHNVEMIHALVRDMPAYLSEECFLSERRLVINKSDLSADLRIHQNKNSLVILLSKWEVAVYPWANASTRGLRRRFVAQPAWWSPRGARFMQILAASRCEWTQWFVLSCPLHDGNTGVKQSESFRLCLHRSNITWRHSVICNGCWDHKWIGPCVNLA